MDKIDWSKYKAVRRTSAFPISSEFNKKRFSIPQLREAASRAKVLFRGRQFISPDPDLTHTIGDGLEMIYNPEGYPRVEQWNLLQSGAFLHRITMYEVYDWKQRKPRDKRVIDTMETIYHVAEVVGSLWRLYEALNVPAEENVTIEFVYEDTKERELVVLDPRRDLLPGRLCYSSEVEVSRTLPLQIWRATDVRTSAEICLDIFQQFQWEPSMQHLEEEIRAFLGKAAPTAAR